MQQSYVEYQWTDSISGHPQRLFGKDRFLRPEPFEWVYEGLTPALPSALLANGGRADPLALVIIYSIVAARQGLNLTPLPGIFTPLAEVPSELPPRLAVRHALLGAAAAPDLPPWILRVEGRNLTNIKQRI